MIDAYAKIKFSVTEKFVELVYISTQKFASSVRFIIEHHNENMLRPDLASCNCARETRE